MSGPDPRRALLVGVSVCLLCAFGSLYVQLPGTLGSHGILPAERLVARVQAAAQSQGLRGGHVLLPSLVWPLRAVLPGGVDSALGALCLGGVLISAATAAACWRQHVPGGVLCSAALLFLHVLYLSLLAVGQQFLSFQWDVLLLEATFVAAVVAAVRRHPSLVLWLPRLALFKLMLMSGAVKLQSRCPTWSKLTALRFHFASQPLPTPLAWHATRYMPDALLRLGVAGTLALEGPLSFLVLSPLPTARRFGALSQVAFMTVIALTGNYCFFNLLTAILALGCLDGPAGQVASTPGERRLSIAVITAVAAVAVACFQAGPPGQRLAGLHLKLTADAMSAALAHVLPRTLRLVFRCLLPVATLQEVLTADRALRASRRPARARLASAASAFAAGFATLIAGAIIAAPLAGLLPDGALVTSALPGVPPAILALANAARVSSSYGLFRIMTGVATDGTTVARPELTIQGRGAPNATLGDSGVAEWLDIPFRFKPGDTGRAPPWVAPHQPRLDWQMWFAALSPSPQGAPWVVHLLTLLLRGEPDVYALLAAAGPFTAEAPPAEARVLAWDYAFTADGSGQQWWARSRPTTWLPPLRLDSPGLDAFLKQNGWPRAQRMRRQDSASWVDAVLRGGHAPPAALAAMAGAGLGVLLVPGGARRHAKTD